MDFANQRMSLLSTRIGNDRSHKVNFMQDSCGQKRGFSRQEEQYFHLYALTNRLTMPVEI